LARRVVQLGIELLEVYFLHYDSFPAIFILLPSILNP
jgi:hypothetical protein